MSDWLKTVIEDHGLWCPNCETAWRILKKDEDGQQRMIEDCYGCEDEAFDIYEADEAGP
jgi:hypothetical protein